MTCAKFHEMMQDRREAKRNGWDIEVQYLTRACRKCVWAIRKVPTMYWEEMENRHELG